VDWEVFQVPIASNILVDLWSPEYTGVHKLPTNTTNLTQALERSLTDLENTGPPFVPSYLRCITVRLRKSKWIAGLGRIEDPPQGLTTAALLEIMHRDRIGRLLEILRTSKKKDLGAFLVTFSDLSSSLVELGAKVAACRQLGTTMDSQYIERWETLLSQLQVIPGSEVLVQELGESANVQVKKSRLEDLALTLKPILRDAGINIAALPLTVLRLHKTRRRMRSEVDWSTIDGLSRLLPDELEVLYRFAAPRAHLSESHACCAAFSAYLTSRFSASMDMLRLCLKFDEDVDQYWLLWAFAVRHLGQRDSFAKIVFDKVRNTSFLCD